MHRVTVFFGIVRNTGSLVGLLVMLLPLILYAADSDKLRTVIADLSGVAQIGERLGRLEAVLGADGSRLDAAEDRIGAVEARLAPMGDRLGAEQVAAFARSGHRVENGAAGDRVRMRWAVTQLRNCGAPLVAARFRNGDGIIHTFRQLSITDEVGRGIELPLDAAQLQLIDFTALIPAHEAVHPGQAQAWLTFDYPDCPNAPLAQSTEVGFTILGRQPERD